MIARVRTVDAILDQVGRFEAIRKADLRRGDRVIVATEQSFDPHEAPMRPPVRTSEDYLREREEEKQKN